MMGVYKTFFCCSILFSASVTSDYFHRPFIGNVKQSDVGVPSYVPDIFKTDKLANAYVKSPGTKNVFKTPGWTGHGQGFLNPDRMHYGGASSENFFKHEMGSHGMSMGTDMGMGMGMGRPSFSMSREDMSGSSSRHEQGCSGMPQTSANAILKCNSFSGCLSTCMQGHQFPNGKTSISILCKNKEWEIQGSEWSTTPACEPICEIPCQNNGICFAPNQCNCPSNFGGPQCQFEQKPCLNNPPLPKNSRRQCTQKSCTITCLNGHQFPDGSAIINLVCKEGNWMSTKHNSHVIPDCIAVCNPPCMNGGVCLSLNVCQCPQEFRGNQCQYSADVCAASKIGFNGGYNCSGDADGVSCSLSCPVGVAYSSDPSPRYTCLYSTGVFKPQPIPQCLFGKDSIITVGGSSKSLYKSMDKSHSSMETSYGNDFIKTGGTYGAGVGYSVPSFDTYGNSYFNKYNLGSLTTKSVNQVMFEDKKPKPGTCFTWTGAHYKTFDGKVYSFESECQHVFVRDAKENSFSINIQNSNRYTRVIIFLEDKEYTFEPSKDGGIIFKSTKRQLPIPAQLPGLRVEMAGHMVQATLELFGVTLKWNGQQYVQVDVTESMWNRTEGLCGRIDGNVDNDLANREGVVPKSIATLANSWLVKKIGGDICGKRPVEQHACSSQSETIVKKAEKFCSDLITKKKFQECSKIMDISLLLESCKWDYCGCSNHTSRESCGCESLGVYASQCFAQGVKSLGRWRDDSTCAMQCTGGRVYNWCGPAVQLSCGSANVDLVNSTSKTGTSCTEGCFCPTGTLNYKGKCVTLDQCPCRSRGKEYSPGTTIPKECNTCTCENSQWVCSQALCGSRCSAVGDPHYQTFDGKRYDFMGQCSYVLMKTTNFSIEAENVACSGAISESMGLVAPGNPWEMPSCTKKVSIVSGDNIIELKQGRVVVINGKTIEKLPRKFCGIKINMVSSLFLKVELPEGVEIWWDGMTRVHIDAPPSMHGKTKGLCGTFNNNQKDDFLTPEGDVEQSIIPFANKWKANEKCEDTSEKDITHPCSANIQNKAIAEKLCAKLKSQIFEECHWSIDVEPFYENCLYDMCACEGPVDRCLCPILGAYATECAVKGVHMQWRYNVKECELQCLGGQTYQVCGDSCARTCYDIAGVYEDSLDAEEEASCRSTCVEGCNCPAGQTLDKYGECIPIGSCQCRHDGLEFPPQYKEVRPGTKQQELCTCIGAKWDCRPATNEEIEKYPRASSIKDKCRESHNEEFTTCESKIPLTCKNMHEGFPGNSISECQPGCQCKKGFVLDSVAKTCVKPENCPCHHGGRSYSDGHQMQEDCNVCKCSGGRWLCDKRECAGVCSTWGDSHFHTYDGRQYDFQGVCSYLLTKGNLDDKNDVFSVEIQNEVCGTSGVTCSKSVTLKVGIEPNMEQITFMKDKPLPNPKSLNRIKIRRAGLFVYAEVPQLGIVLQWDKGTRVYVKADPKWKGRMKGLCGNYDENEVNDFQTPSGGALEATAKLFGDSWKLQPHCPQAQETQDTCSLHPERKAWSVQRCSILKSFPFSMCHSEVPPDLYLERCEKDTCACGLGGDCECLCTALAAYAFECASRGVPIKWRTQELCPMQCDETCSNYSPCISACPVETCDNTLEYKQITTMCNQDTCIEGCEKNKKCSSGFVYSNDTGSECVPRTNCKSTCMTLESGKVILEGEIIEKDECHTCHCSRGKSVCIGQPCSTIPDVGASTESTLMEQKSKCVEGWTDWISESIPDSVKTTKSSKPYSVEKEEIPTLLQMLSLNGAVCDRKNITDIECRTVEKQTPAKSTGLNAECSIENGLYCRQPQSRPCPDFEIRVLCECGKHKAIMSTSKPHELETDDDEDTSRILPVSLSKPIKQAVVEETYPISPVGYSKPTSMSQVVCDTSKPHQEHPDDCALFLHCAPGMGPQEHPDVVIKTCAPHMLYNPKSMNCDWPETVVAMKPQCKDYYNTVVSSKLPSEKIEDSWEKTVEVCENGQVWSECAVNCKRACLYYYYTLKKRCKLGDECLPGCVDKAVAKIKCDKGFFWRDSRTCIKPEDCTCVSHTGKIVKPGEVVKESHCEICQCIQNHYTCDKSSCSESIAIMIGPSSTPSTFSEEEVEEIEPSMKQRKNKIKFPHYLKVTDATTQIYDEDHSIGVAFIPPFTTMSPPPECHPDGYTSVLWDDEQPLGDQAFSASSDAGKYFKPQFAKLNDREGSWSPADTDKKPYIQFKLNRKEPLYGITMQGNPLYDQYVTSYNVMYGDDGKVFDYVKSKETKSPKVFRGPVDNETPVKQMFDIPFEAKYVKVVPLTWHDSVSMRLDIIGCTEVTTSTIPEDFEVEETVPVAYKPRPRVTKKTTITPILLTSPEIEPKKCVDPMGVGENIIPASSISVSSHKTGFLPAQLSTLQSDSAWQPLTNSPGEWIQFNFLDDRNLTGIKTKGGPKGWVTAYNVQYSPDGSNWNPILNEDKNEKVFLANFDHKTDATNYFDLPIQAQYLKIMPTKWHQNIQMRVEPIGCFLPYDMELEPILHFTVGPEVEIEVCNTCKGVDAPSEGCDCAANEAYNGDKCVSQMECPCVVGHIKYPVGAKYEAENCELCVCKLGGVSQCSKKSCPKCEKGLISSTTIGCDCICSPCPDGQRICPTSEICIPEELWCNGVQNCPDDETDCYSTTEMTTSEAESLEKTCPTPKCPTGYKIVEKKEKNTKFNLMTDDTSLASGSIFGESARAAKQSYMRYYKGSTKTGVKGGLKGGIKSKYVVDVPIQRKALEKPTKAIESKPEECVEWRCVSTRPPPAFYKKGVKATLPPCPAPKCPPEYILKMENNEFDEYDCPKYSCVPPPRQDKVCNVTCRTINTFDGTDYQYDICNHILARDADDNAWDVSVQKNCTKNVCINEILITQGTDNVRFRPDLSVEYNGYFYTVDQTRKIGFQTQTFIISRLGNSLFFVSSQYGFWVIYDFEGNIKLGASGHLYGRIDGLCGFYNGKQEDDRRKPDGSQALSTEEFGDSWEIKDTLDTCRNPSCPLNIQEEAYNICSFISTPFFEECAPLVDEELSRVRCVENTCNCLQSDTNSTDKIDVAKRISCTCAAFQTYVTDCLAADPAVDLKSWRNVMHCPATCPAPLVHYECYKRSCEPTCTSMGENEQCPSAPGICFSGCFCPEGLIRKDNDCINATDCRDCACNSLGKGQFLTFDNRNLTFDGKCAYTLFQNKGVVTENFKFNLYVAQDQCPHDKKSSCTTGFYLMFNGRDAVIKKHKDKLHILVDGKEIRRFPLENDWIEIQKISGNDITLMIKEFHFELSLVFHNMAFSVRIPKYFYQYGTQGICGDCGDDNSEKTVDFSKDIASWRAPDFVLDKMGIKSKECFEKPKEECWPLPEDEDPCIKILDPSRFGKCHLVVDPTPYLHSCQQQFCTHSKKVDVCNSLEAYARECRTHGVCLDWRRENLCPYECKEGLEYKPCETGCQLTCDNYEKYTKDPGSCSATINEGCFCSHGEVLNNGECIDESKCSPCDSDGHYVGDTWQLDDCTECTCSKESKITCTERSCAKAMTCTQGFKAQQVAKVPGQCCHEFVCIPEPTKETVCPDPVKISCGFGQVMKLETMSNGCAQYICTCKPIEECDEIDLKSETESLEPGMVKEIDSSGCCPKAKYVCKHETCPKTPKCPRFYNVKYTQKEEDCCPKYSCEPPTNKCLYDMEYDAAKVGGEIKRKTDDIETLSKSINAIWQDGPCRSCVCKKNNDKMQAVCSVTQCPQISSTEDFEIESNGVPFTCCPQPKYIACKQNDKKYKVDEEWISDTNPCESFKCVLKEDGTLEKQKNVKDCNDKCNLGSKYVKSTNKKICCGDCVPFACVVDNIERKIGEQWTSKDFCKKFVCLDKNGTVQVQSSKVNCPVISENQKEEYEFKEISVDGECCKINKPIACKDNGKKHKIDDLWASETNPCESFKCVMKDDGSLEKQTSVKHCENKCKKGWKYLPPMKPKEKCCGECVPFACVVNDKEYKIGEKWHSEDHCINYVCLNKNGNVQVQSDRINCPSIPENQQDDYEFEEIPVKGKCCKNIKPIACKVNDKIYKIDETWESEENPCESFKCVSKGDGVLEKQTNVKHCDDVCKQGSKYVESKDPTVCCGECVPFACIVHGVERNIGEKWTSKDFCTKHICSDKKGTIQVESIKVSCPEVNEAQKEDFKFKEITVDGECCKKTIPIACLINGKVFEEGSSWTDPKGDPCKNVTCTRDSNGELIKKESFEACNTDCPLGWEYSNSDDPETCCGKCVQIACVVGEKLYKPEQVWHSHDKCTEFSCDHQSDNLVVTSNQEVCPDIKGCDSNNIYMKGCCKYCNITAMSQSLCVSENLPPKETIGLVKRLVGNHGMCVNKDPIPEFKECRGTCNSGTSFDQESFSYKSDCKCCQAKGHTTIMVHLICEDKHSFKTEVQIPKMCDCQECGGETLSVSKNTKYGRKVSPRFDARAKFAPEESDSYLDDVELLK